MVPFSPLVFQCLSAFAPHCDAQFSLAATVDRRSRTAESHRVICLVRSCCRANLLREGQSLPVRGNGVAMNEWSRVIRAAEKP